MLKPRIDLYCVARLNRHLREMIAGVEILLADVGGQQLPVAVEALQGLLECGLSFPWSLLSLVELTQGIGGSESLGMPWPQLFQALTRLLETPLCILRPILPFVNRAEFLHDTECFSAPLAASLLVTEEGSLERTFRFLKPTLLLIDLAKIVETAKRGRILWSHGFLVSVRCPSVCLLGLPESTSLS